MAGARMSSTFASTQGSRNRGQRKAVMAQNVSTSDFQSEVGEVFGEIGGELPAKFGRRFSSFFCRGKSSEEFSTKTPPQISPSNFTTRFWVVAGPKMSRIVKKGGSFLLRVGFFLLRVELLCLQSIQVLIRDTFLL